ncbi:MAG: hypothetical protein ACKVZ6_22915 [Kineosporiaceae bacterium]
MTWTRFAVADEPTGQLDSQTGRAVMDLLSRLVHDRGMTAVVATHDPALVGLADAVVDLTDGAVSAPGARRTSGRHAAG